MFKTLADAVFHYLTAGFLTVEIIDKSCMMVGKAGQIIIVCDSGDGIKTVTLN